jgi:hypothetical protein
VTDRAEHAARRRLPLAALVLLALVGAALVVLAILYLDRRQLAREAVTRWLAERGVVSESQFSDVGPGRLVGRIRIGRPDAPDLVVDRAEVSYDLGGLLAGRGARVTSVRLERPVLRARWQDGRLTFGALDRLIAEFRKRPPSPGAPSPRIEIDHGRLLLASDYGALTASVDALVDDSRLVRLAATTAPGRFAVRGATAQLGAASLEAHATPGGRLAATLSLPFGEIAAQGSALRDGILRMTADLAYPTPDKQVASTGAVQADLTAAGLAAPGATVGAVHLRAEAPDLAWTRNGGEQLAGALRLAGEGRDLAAGDLHLATLVSDASGGFALGGAPSLHLAGDVQARGGFAGLGPPSAADSAQIAALKRGVRAFALSIRGVALDVGRDGPRVRLTGAARLAPQAGGEVRLAPAGSGYRLTATGGGLPRVEADVRRVAFVSGGLRADGRIKAGLSIGPLEAAQVDAAGALSVDHGVARFTAERCAEVSAAKLAFGDKAAERLSGRLCPGRAPLLTIGHGGWAIDGRAEHVAAEVPFLQAGFTDASGEVRLADAAAGLSATLRLASARAHDRAPKLRFHPLLVSGQVTAAHDLWRGAFDARTPTGAHLAAAELRHDGRTGVGSLTVESGEVAFAPAGLQPADLSPIAAGFGSAFDGRAAFTGVFRWTKAGGGSQGDLVLSGLNFKSPAGQVSGLAGKVHFTSLAPLIAPPGQALTARSLAAIVPVSELSARFGLGEQALTVSSAQAHTGGGALTISDLSVPLKAGQPVKGVVQVDGVQLHDLVAASPFGDRVSLDARVSGRIPFEVTGEKLRIAGGELHAIEPGRLSISRAALTSVSAQGSVEAPPAVAAAASAPVANTDTFTDFAYQALENLAFDQLDAQVDSQPEGRLGVLFHIKGRHDPPQHQEITLSWMDLIRRRFMDKKLPLPSGTQVNLTLDTSLDLDDLLKDYADYQALRSSPPVQR